MSFMRQIRDSRLLRHLLLAVVLCADSHEAHGSTAPEYAVKAAFLYNFGKFVTYPNASAGDDTTPFCIAVLGDDPFGPVLDETVQGKTINSRKSSFDARKRSTISRVARSSLSVRPRRRYCRRSWPSLRVKAS